MTADITFLTEVPLALGEGVRLVPGGVVFVDILAGDLFSHPGDRTTQPRRLAHVDLPLDAVSPVTGRPDAWIAAVGDRIAILEPGRGPRWLARPEAGHAGRTRMNDGVCDPHGRFWAGSMAYDGTSALGSLYRVDHYGSVHVVLDHLVIANGPAFSADGSTMFLADSGRGLIMRFRVTPQRSLTDAVIIAREESGVVPDGMTVDTEGALWVAMWGGSEIRRYSPEGEILANVRLPASQPTSVALVQGGAVVTTARIGLDQPSDADGLVRLVALPGAPRPPGTAEAFG